jgi:hypothetical protein
LKFSYAHIDEPIASQRFRAPTEADVPRQPFKLDDGYDRFILTIRDGSDGEMAARWGQKGKKGTSNCGMGSQ